MNRKKLETILRTSGLSAVKRVNVDGNDVLIADGFSPLPHVAFKRFGIEPGEFPGGCFATIWLLTKDENIDVGQPLFFELFHDPDLSSVDKCLARINAAIKTATEFIANRKRIKNAVTV